MEENNVILYKISPGKCNFSEKILLLSKFFLLCDVKYVQSNPVNMNISQKTTFKRLQVPH